MRGRRVPSKQGDLAPELTPLKLHKVPPTVKRLLSGAGDRHTSAAGPQKRRATGLNVL